MSPVLARFLAVLAAVLCVGGFLLTAAMHARALELRPTPLPRWEGYAFLFFFAVPYLVGFTSAVAARRDLVPVGLVLVGCAINAWIASEAWRNHARLPHVQLALGLLQTWVFQFLVCSFAVAGGIEGIKQARRRRAEQLNPDAPTQDGHRS
jgi:hypothetical protein